MPHRVQDLKLTQLASVPFFRSCSPAEFVLLGRLAERTTYPAGVILQREGEPGRAWSVLERGSAAASGAGRPRHLFAAGDCWGEVSLLTRSPAGETVVALTDVAVFGFERRAFLGVLDEVPIVAFRLLGVMARRELAASLQGGRATAMADSAV